MDSPTGMTLSRLAYLVISLFLISPSKSTSKWLWHNSTKMLLSRCGLLIIGLAGGPSSLIKLKCQIQNLLTSTSSKLIHYQMISKSTVPEKITRLLARDCTTVGLNGGEDLTQMQESTIIWQMQCKGSWAGWIPCIQIMEEKNLGNLQCEITEGFQTKLHFKKHWT